MRTDSITYSTAVLLGLVVLIGHGSPALAQSSGDEGGS